MADPISGIGGAMGASGIGGAGGISGMPGMPSAQPSGPQAASFSDVFQEMVIKRPTEAHHEADRLATEFAAGGNIDPHQIAIATAKAGLEVQMATRTIQQTTSAIRTLMQMQI
jgi:flagellar hook-basal body complex protein FliE